MLGEQYKPNSDVEQGKGRKVRKEWFLSYNWLHFDKSTHTVVCYICCKAIELKLIEAGKELAFSVGFSNWKKAIERYKSHEKSGHHLEAALKYSHHMNAPCVLSQVSKQ